MRTLDHKLSRVGGLKGMAREQERSPGAEDRSPFAQRHRGIRGTGGRGPGQARLGRGERLGRGAQRRAPPSRPRGLVWLPPTRAPYLGARG